MRWILLLPLLLLLMTGCASLPANHDEFYKTVGSVCTPTVLELPAPGGGVYKMPIPNPSKDAACQQGMVTAFQINQSGWERFGTATVNGMWQTVQMGVQQAPYGALYGVAYHGFQAAGKNISGSYNTDNSQHDLSNNSNQGNDLSNNSNQGNDLSDNRSNYSNTYPAPVVVPDTVVVPPVIITPTQEVQP